MLLPSSVKRYFFIFFLIVLIDQATKFVASRVMLNQGIAFGFPFLSRSVATQIAVLSFCIVVLAAASWSWARRREILSLHAAFFGATASQLLDRVLFGGVRDIWPMLGGGRNNFADIAITLVVLLATCEILWPGCLRQLQLLFMKMKPSWFLPNRQGS